MFDRSDVTTITRLVKKDLLLYHFAHELFLQRVRQMEQQALGKLNRVMAREFGEESSNR